MARTDWVWEIVEPWNYIKPIGDDWYDILVYWDNRYINFNTLNWVNWYWFRDNAWVIEVKNSWGSWTSYISWPIKLLYYPWNKRSIRYESR